ncbi:MAG: preprotein translocase subunit SecG, partial [Deltaproteobacteria bacterium]|nr:preprotein translocase subunit SecG [Deltaproteobacteria bacterium]
MINFLTILYVAVCIFLILVVLLQSGKGGGMGGIGGGMGGAGQQVFGGAGAGNLLTKLTGTSAALFM